jgi:alcohol dehydrogenase
VTLFGAGRLAELGRVARALGFTRTLLAADPGMVSAGYAARAERFLQSEAITVVPFHEFTENPTNRQAGAGRDVAAAGSVDSIIGLGGGSSLDMAKAINFLLTNGALAPTTKPMLPMIGIPTTTGTGSEAQTHALISDAGTHVKSAYGSPGAAFRVSILDPELALTQPLRIRATTGYDAISHAVESFVTTRRSSLSDCYAQQAWTLLSASFERCLTHLEDIAAISNMQIGAYLAGCAIENSMLGAAHACANPLTARYGTVHGDAIALMLSHVVRWNAQPRHAGLSSDLAPLLDAMALAACLPRRLRDAGVIFDDIPSLAADAAQQWTGRFNPRPFDQRAAEELYRCAY